MDYGLGPPECFISYETFTAIKSKNLGPLKQEETGIILRALD